MNENKPEELEPMHWGARLAGRYVLRRRLGRGGMGAVYEAIDEATGRQVAIKQLLSSFEGEQRRKLEALFEREYHTLVRLRHPRIIEVYDYGITECGPYYTMELLEGDDLQGRAPIPYRELCRHLRDIASSLALIHAHQLVHRDVSPRNVRFTNDGRAKLIDFGALAPFGSAKDVVGTPSCMAPEALNAMPLDQRTDLFALGAVAYVALTGRAAYPARRLSELRSVWAFPPDPPSKWVPGIPPELDLLVLSLLNLDPLARPANAAEVIDQLTALAELEPEEHDHTAEAYVVSSNLVGRDRELEWFERRTTRLLNGHGAEIIVEGPAGIGKTRLVHEAVLKSQLLGATVIQADALAAPGGFGVAAALSVQLLRSCPEVALRAVEPHASLIAHLSPELWEKLGKPKLMPLELNPGERRVRLQTALHDWFLEVVKAGPMFVAVDNLQAADDNSAAFLAALGHRARELPLMVVYTQRIGEPVVAAAPVRALRRRAGRLKLGSLTSDDYVELVKSLFGDVANVGRLAKLLYDRSAGNPQQTMDYVRLLVKKQTVKYVGGTWVLPLAVSEDELPSRVESLIAARLSALKRPARALAEALSLQTKPLSIELCRALVERQTDAEFHAALDELVTEQILVADGSNYRFAQAPVRDAVLARLDAPARRALHRRAAEVFLAVGEGDLAARMEAGWHLLRAGEENRGVEILATAGRAFVADQSGGQSSEQGFRALRAVLAIYDKQKRSDYELARILFPLLPLAYFVDWRLVNEYSERAINVGLRITGLALAQKLRPVLGQKLSLMTGLAVAQARFLVEQRRGLDYGLIEAIGLACAVIPAAAGAAATCLDTAKLERFIAMVEPLSYFPRQEFPRLIYDHLSAETAQNAIRGESVELMKDVAARFHDPKIKALLGEGHWKAMYGGVLFMLGLASAFTFGSVALDTAREMDELGVRVWAMTADHLRLLYHALRGETEQVQHYLARVEVFAVQGSTTWQADMFYPALLFNAHVLAEDTLAVRRSWEQLSRRAAEVPSLQAHANAAHAAYLVLRGDVNGAILEFERLLPQFPPRARMNWSSVRSYLAKALNMAGEHERAKAVCEDVLGNTTEADRRLAFLTFEPIRQLALAEAGLGNHEEATSTLHTMLAAYGAEDQPMLLGLIHQALAEVALVMRDSAEYRKHAEAMEALFRSVKNPTLVAQCDRLAAKAVRAGIRDSIRPPPDATSRSAARIDTPPPGTDTFALGDLRSAPDPCEHALRLVMQQTEARSGHLYVSWEGEIGLACASPADEPAGALESELRDMVRAHMDATLRENLSDCLTEHARLRASASDVPNPVPPKPQAAPATATSFEAVDNSPTVFFQSLPPEARPGNHQLFVLSTRRLEHTQVVGGLILEMEAQNRFRLHSGLLEAIATILDERLMGEASVAGEN